MSTQMSARMPTRIDPAGHARSLRRNSSNPKKQNIFFSPRAWQPSQRLRVWRRRRRWAATARRRCRRTTSRYGQHAACRLPPAGQLGCSQPGSNPPRRHCSLFFAHAHRSKRRGLPISLMVLCRASPTLGFETICSMQEYSVTWRRDILVIMTNMLLSLMFDAGILRDGVLERTRRRDGRSV